jgi:hypothetical protein
VLSTQFGLGPDVECACVKDCADLAPSSLACFALRVARTGEISRFEQNFGLAGTRLLLHSKRSSSWWSGLRLVARLVGAGTCAKGVRESWLLGARLGALSDGLNR